MDYQDIRPSPIAGTWYPGNPVQLESTIDQFLEDSGPPEFDGEPIGVVAPHAGHKYSGGVAAHAYRCLDGCSPNTVAIVSPMHMPAEGSVIVSSHDAYETPLGRIPVHRELIQRFRDVMWNQYGIHINQIKNDSEHSLEIQLPFLQRVLRSPFSLLPIMLRDQSQTTVEHVGHTLGDILIGESAVLVASSDLSHFYSQTIANQLDTELLSRLARYEPERVLSAEEEGLGFACGRGAIASVLWAARDLGANAVKILDYATSGDVTSDYSSVVGYGSAVIYKQTTS